MAEQDAVNVKVEGSSPSLGADDGADSSGKQRSLIKLAAIIFFCRHRVVGNMDDLTIGLIALAGAGLGIILASFFGVLRAIDVYLQRRDAKRTYAEALIEDRLVEALNELYYAPSTPAVNHRHNIHCPSCGRFSKKVLDMTDVVECKVHGVQVRWKDMPVDWAIQPVAEGVTIVTGPINIIHQPLGVELPAEPALDMQPIDHRRLVQMIPEAA